jgi:ADP-ribose pyrophosphatase YjhB (NUDIX family)
MDMENKRFNNVYPSLRNPSQQDYIPQVSIDCVIFGYQDNQLKVLVPKLDFKGDFWALPSGFVFQNEDIDDAAQRILQDRTQIQHVYLEQFRVFGKVGRSRMDFLDRLIELNPEKFIQENQVQQEYDWFTRRFISIGYYALVDIYQVTPQKTSLDVSIEWYNIADLPPLIMDSHQIVMEALKALREDLYKNLHAFKLLPETFTMKEVQALYEAIFDKPFVRTNFQKMILDLNVLERLEKKFTGAANKAPYLYRTKKDVAAKGG